MASVFCGHFFYCARFCAKSIFADLIVVQLYFFFMILRYSYIVFLNKINYVCIFKKNIQILSSLFWYIILILSLAKNQILYSCLWIKELPLNSTKNLSLNWTMSFAHLYRLIHSNTINLMVQNQVQIFQVNKVRILFPTV